MSLSADIVCRTVKTQKQFMLEPGKCFYVNIETVRKNYKNEDEPVIKIVNTVCKQVNSHLSKITQIRFKQKLIIIQDQYIFKYPIENGFATNGSSSSHQTKSSDGSNHNNPLSEGSQYKNGSPVRKKKLIFKKKYLQDNIGIEKRNTKNIAKNFCKAFLNYLEEIKSKDAQNQAKQIMGYYNYNNKTIEALGKDEVTKTEFKEFLTNKADDWVESSKVYDKKIHKQAIPLYLSLIQTKIDNSNESRDHQMKNQKEENQESQKNNSHQKIINYRKKMKRRNKQQISNSDQIFEQNSQNGKRQ